MDAHLFFRGYIGGLHKAAGEDDNTDFLVQEALRAGGEELERQQLAVLTLIHNAGGGPINVPDMNTLVQEKVSVTARKANSEAEVQSAIQAASFEAEKEIRTAIEAQRQQQMTPAQRAELQLGRFNQYMYQMGVANTPPQEPV